MVDFEGTALQRPGVAFKAVLTRNRRLIRRSGVGDNEGQCDLPRSLLLRKLGNLLCEPIVTCQPSSSSFVRRQSVTAFARRLGFGFGAKMAS